MPDNIVLGDFIPGLIAFIAIVGWIIYALVSRRKIRRLRAEMGQLDSQKRSQSTRYGQITEQFAPLLGNWPWDPKRFHFIGSPIDGIQFTDKGIVLVEIKTASSQLSAVQRQVRDQVQAGLVAWHEHRIE